MLPRALVTGATGFIGSHLATELSSRRWRVTCLLRSCSRKRLPGKLRVEVIRGDPEDLSLLQKAVRGQDYVFHLAGRIRAAPPEIYERANHLLTRNLLAACLREKQEIKRFVYVSSIAASGPSAPGETADESLPPRPVSLYGLTKRRGEEAVQEVWDTIPATILRPCSVYGGGQQETMLLMKLMRRRIVPLLRERKEKTSLLYVKDLVSGILQATASKKARKQVYFLTDGRAYSWKDVMRSMKRVILGDALFLPLPEIFLVSLARLSDALRTLGLARFPFGFRAWNAMAATHWLFSSSKATRDFGFQPRFTLEAGLRNVIAENPVFW